MNIIHGRSQESNDMGGSMPKLMWFAEPELLLEVFKNSNVSLLVCPLVASQLDKPLIVIILLASMIIFYGLSEIMSLAQNNNYNTCCV